MQNQKLKAEIDQVSQVWPYSCLCSLSPNRCLTLPRWSASNGSWNCSWYVPLQSWHLETSSCYGGAMNVEGSRKMVLGSSIYPGLFLLAWTGSRCAASWTWDNRAQRSTRGIRSPSQEPKPGAGAHLSGVARSVLGCADSRTAGFLSTTRCRSSLPHSLVC